MSAQMQTCAVCGGQVPTGARFCPSCGHTMAPANDAPETPRPAWQAQQHNPNPAQTTYIEPQANETRSFPQVQPPQSRLAMQPYSHAPLGASPTATGALQQYGTGFSPAAQRDATVGLMLEFIGYLGVLGLGHIYTGQVGRGFALMIGWWAYWGIVTVLFVTIFFIPVACMMVIAWPVVPILSGLWVKRDIDRRGAGL